MSSLSRNVLANVIVIPSIWLHKFHSSGKEKKIYLQITNSNQYEIQSSIYDTEWDKNYHTQHLSPISLVHKLSLSSLTDYMINISFYSHMYVLRIIFPQLFSPRETLLPKSRALQCFLETEIESIQGIVCVSRFITLGSCFLTFEWRKSPSECSLIALSLPSLSQPCHRRRR